ncbi:MAG TPA: hypothetical protein VGP55_16100 [Chitinophagaceae bacterium]|nr:hypothetical protein [Chitinophagaceae bacterium]
MPEEKREVWQRGPWENIPGLLQPVAHALVQAREELKDLTDNFPEYLYGNGLRVLLLPHSTFSI